MSDYYQSPLANSFETEVGAIVESVRWTDRVEFFMQSGLDIGLSDQPLFARIFQGESLELDGLYEISSREYSRVYQGYLSPRGQIAVKVTMGENLGRRESSRLNPFISTRLTDSLNYLELLQEPISIGEEIIVRGVKYFGVVIGRLKEGMEYQVEFMEFIDRPSVKDILYSTATTGRAAGMKPERKQKLLSLGNLVSTEVPKLFPGIADISSSNVLYAGIDPSGRHKFVIIDPAMIIRRI